MAKKKSGKYKGVQYIAQTLRKYSGKKYSNYSIALQRAREIKGELKDSKVTVKNVMALVRKKREPKFVATLPQFLLDTTPFYELNEYQNIILSSVSNKIQFVSNLFPDEVEPMYGGFDYEYQTYFAPFVNFCNKLKLRIEQQTGQQVVSPVEWNVRCLPPDKQNISKIISCTEDGVEFDFGFDPSAPENFEKTIFPKTTTKEKPTEKKPTANFGGIEIEKEKTKQLEITEKIKKTETINNAMNLLREGVITNAEFKDIMNSLK